jgi:hypothetical protein
LEVNMTRPNQSRRRLTLCTLALGLGVAVTGQAQTWPERPITVVIPYAAGGVTDVSVREILRKMSESLGQPIVVDNKPGGGTLIAAQLVARAKPDGYTLLANVGATMVTGPLLAPTPIFDPLKEVATRSCWRLPRPPVSRAWRTSWPRHVPSRGSWRLPPTAMARRRTWRSN